MRILFDQGTPIPLKEYLTGHSVATAYEKGWSTLRNGELLTQAEAQFDVLVTTDRNLQFQQNLAARHLAIVVLPTTSCPACALSPRRSPSSWRWQRRGQSASFRWSNSRPASRACSASA